MKHSKPLCWQLRRLQQRNFALLFTWKTNAMSQTNVIQHAIAYWLSTTVFLPTRVRGLIWVRGRLWMSPQVLEANSWQFCWYRVRCVLMTTGPYSDNLWKLRDMILNEICECGP